MIVGTQDSDFIDILIHGTGRSIVFLRNGPKVNHKTD